MSLELETDLERIEDLSEDKEDENWGFRTFLKSEEVSSRRIDAMVMRLYKIIAPQINCEECRNCCKTLLPAITQQDISAMAKRLKLKEAEIIEKYLEKEETGENYTVNSSPCPFLKDNECILGENQPKDCAEYPYLHKKRFVDRTMTVIQNCAICPIVFNVFEALKREIWSMVDEDDSMGDELEDDFY